MHSRFQTCVCNLISRYKKSSKILATQRAIKRVCNLISRYKKGSKILATQRTIKRVCNLISRYKKGSKILATQRTIKRVCNLTSRYKKGSKILATQRAIKRVCNLTSRYKKSSKILATQRAIKRTQADVDEDEHDPEFVVQHLNRPTASSRNRQVNQVPSSHAVSASPSGHSIQSRKKTISIGNPVIHPHRFKGTRSVTSEELHKIVSRLSACDPAQVPDSGCSRSKGKGFSRGAGYGAGFKATSRSAPRSGSGYGVHESAYVLGPSVRGVIY